MQKKKQENCAVQCYHLGTWTTAIREAKKGTKLLSGVRHLKKKTFSKNMLFKWDPLNWECNGKNSFISMK